jgi:hypothetical protein
LRASGGGIWNALYNLPPRNCESNFTIIAWEFWEVFSRIFHFSFHVPRIKEKKRSEIEVIRACQTTHLDYCENTSQPLGMFTSDQQLNSSWKSSAPESDMIQYNILCICKNLTGADERQDLNRTWRRCSAPDLKWTSLLLKIVKMFISRKVFLKSIDLCLVLVQKMPVRCAKSMTSPIHREGLAVFQTSCFC